MQGNLGQREITAELTYEELTSDEKELIAKSAFTVLKAGVSTTGVKTINAALGSLGLLENKHEDTETTHAPSGNV